MPLPPLRFAPLLVEKPWGGRRLARYGKQLPDDVLIGESWEIADLDPASTSVGDPATPVAGGPLDGTAPSTLVAEHGRAFLGDARPAPGERFPLLVKLLDAREDLSIQVHPPADYVIRHPETHLKTESWYVMDADPGTSLLLGTREGVTHEDLAAAAGGPGIAELLNRVPARVGEVHHLPAGTLHALGSGVMVAEIQTPSDTTFRLYDWAEEHGRPPRDLHLEAALECATLTSSEPVAPNDGEHAFRTLVETPHYTLAEHLVAADSPLRLEAGLLRVLMVVRGRLTCEGLDGALAAGDTFLLPAERGGTLHASERTILLEAVPAA